ncbi:MAG: hypothetical protein R2718_05410 [Solirubrobacterales bacterium]
MESIGNTSIRRGAVAAALACLLALALAAAADAAQRTVRDAKFDTPYLTKKGRLDITKATAERRLTRVTHSITVRAKARPARNRERPTILINTRGGRRSAYEFVVYGSTIFRAPKRGPLEPVASAALVAEKRTWRYRFDLDDVPGVGAGYGWAAATQKLNGRFADVAPDGGYVGSP